MTVKNGVGVLTLVIAGALAVVWLAPGTMAGDAADPQDPPDRKKPVKVTAQLSREIFRRTVRGPIGSVPSLKPIKLDDFTQIDKELMLPGVCAAPMPGEIRMDRIGLRMKTKDRAIWYSLVDTIPPVGHTASITVEPVRLVSEGREVGTLLSGEVKFREVVEDMALPSLGAEPVTGPGDIDADRQKVVRLLADFRGMAPARLAALNPLPVEQWKLPEAGIQVMRATVEETYSIDGVGVDTVELNGWIAVKHGDPRAAAGESQVTWNTAVIDTDFVGLELTGESALFGPVKVTLDATRTAHGQVGRIEIPALARLALVARLQKHQLAMTVPASRAPAQAHD
jgi:hypothetical protein